MPNLKRQFVRKFTNPDGKQWENPAFQTLKKYLKSDLRLFCQQLIDVARYFTEEYIMYQS